MNNTLEIETKVIKPEKKRHNRTRYAETRTYSNKPSAVKAEIEEYCAEYPWYRGLMDDIKETLRLRSNRQREHYLAHAATYTSSCTKRMQS